jgi:hypothetical protein
LQPCKFLPPSFRPFASKLQRDNYFLYFQEQTFALDFSFKLYKESKLFLTLKAVISATKGRNQGIGLISVILLFPYNAIEQVMQYNPQFKLFE